MDFLNHREGGHYFLSGFPPFSLQYTVTLLQKYVRGCVCLKKYKSQGKAVEANRKKEKS